jgi:putative membrane protein
LPRCYKPAVVLSALVFSALGIFGGLASPAAAAIRSSNDLDRSTVVTLVMNAVTQVKLCGLALEKSQNADVRSLCRKASSDGARTAIAGMQLAQAIGATDAKLQPVADTSAKIDALTQFSGHDFDREFLLAQIENAEDEEHTLRYVVEVTTDTSVKRYESTVLPKIESHLELAESALRGVAESAP